MYMSHRTFLKRSAFLLFAAAVIGGCSSDTVDEPDEPVGRVVVNIKDNNNNPVSGILVDLFVTTNTFTPWSAATTNASGTAEFSASVGGVKPQSYIVRVITLTTYELAAGETNNKPVTAVANQTATVNFTLSKKVIGQQ
jgi:hypothetical protein